MRDDNGRFLKGVHSSPCTEFKKGQHWRMKQPFWNKEWCIENYIVKKRSSREIADEFGVTDAAILHWLKKHGIERRDVSEARKVKKWGLVGIDNPMWNKRGELNPRWQGGITPERQSFYTSEEWKIACSFVWRRDDAICRRCKLDKRDSADMPFHIHHIRGFADKNLRADPNNLILVCEVCHHFIHSKENVNDEYIQKI